jgi:hypothetical protein
LNRVAGWLWTKKQADIKLNPNTCGLAFFSIEDKTRPVFNYHRQTTTAEESISVAVFGFVSKRGGNKQQTHQPIWITPIAATN